MQERRWISVHLFYHDDLTHVLRGWVQPLVETLHTQQLLASYFFIRYWQGGPHVRLRLLPQPHGSREQIEACVEAQARVFLQQSPSTQILNDQQYKELTTRLSFLEYGSTEEDLLYPNNSLQYIAYEPEYEQYGGEAALVAVEEQFELSSACAMDLLLRPDSPVGQKTTHSLVCLFLALSVETHDIEQLARMAEEYYDSWERIPAPVRERFTAQFARQYQQQRPKIHALLRTLWQSHQSGLPLAVPTLYGARWQTSLQGLMRALERIEGESGLRVMHPYHVIPLKTNICLRCAHMHNNRLGILLLEEAYVLYMLRCSLREAVSNQEILMERVQLHD